MGAVGLVEFFGGIFIAVGFLTRPSAFAAMIVMAGVYLTVHLPNGNIPIMNKGELAMLFMVSFLFISFFGARKFGVDKLISRRIESKNYS